MIDNENSINQNNLSINIVEQKEYGNLYQRGELKRKTKRENIRKISAELKQIENQEKKSDFPQKKDYFNKKSEQELNQNNNINNINQKDDIINNQKNEYNNNFDNKKKVNNNQVKFNTLKKEQNNNSENKKNNISEELKIKFDNIIKNDFEYQNVLPFIQKGSYLTGLPDSIFNNTKNKNNSKIKGEYQETTKILKNLKEKENSLNKEISSIKNKKQKILNISYGNTGSSAIEKNKNNYEEKRLQSIENNLIEKLDEVKNQIKDIIEREETLKKNKSSLIQNFIKKYENQENAEKLAQKYLLKNNNYTERTMLKLQKDCNTKNLNRYKNKEKSKFKLNEENENKNEINQKIMYLKEQKEKEKEIIKKRKKRIDEQMKKIKEQVKKTESRPLQNYLFYRMANSFEEKENLFFKNIKLTKKSEVIGKEELKKLYAKYIEAKKQLKKKAEEKTLDMKKCWHSRSLILPKYKSPILKVIQQDEKNKIEEEEKKQNKKNKFYENKKKYFKDVVPLPKINQNLRKEMIKKNFSMLDLYGKKRVKYIKEELNKINIIRKNSFNLENKRFRQSNNLNKRYKYRIAKINKEKSIITEKKAMNGLDNIIKTNNSMELNNIRKFEKKIYSPINKIIRKPKDIDYLKEYENNHKSKNYNWDKYIEDDDDENKAIRIQNVKSKIEALDNKAQRKQFLLKIKGGASIDQKVENDLSNLLINSLRGKLSVIKAINKE